MLRRFALIGCIAVIAASPLSPVKSAMWGSIEVFPGEEIPTLNPVTLELYETWSLFLICNPSWFDKRDTARLEELFVQFKLFGDAIGNRHLAVWFAPATESTGQGVTVLDVSRNVDFCEKYHLPPSLSPYVLTTTRDPNLKTEEGDLWELSLAGQTDANIETLLMKLADQVLVEGLDQEALGSEQYWRSWYSILDGAIRNTAEIASRITLTIKTANFSIEAQYNADQ